MKRTAMPFRSLIAVVATLLLAGCGEEAPLASETGRPVRVITVEATELSNAASLTGQIEAHKDIDAAFRIGGRMIERPVNVGDAVKAGQLLARLDPTTEQNALRAAKAAATAARGEVVKTRNVFQRQQQLLDQGFTTRRLYDEAKQALDTAEAQLEDAEARVETAADRLTFGELRADAAGIVTSRGAEPGEVVAPGQMIVRLARDDGRDAVFDVPAAQLHAEAAVAVVRVALASDPAVKAVGRVREVSPQADTVTRTFKVRVGLQDPPEMMRLGSTVTGTVELTSSVVVVIPANALTTHQNAPAVWIVDPASSGVSLRIVDVLRYEPDRVVIAQGLEPGDVVVTAGGQALRPGQIVSPLPSARTASTPLSTAAGKALVLRVKAEPIPKELEG